MLEAFDLTGSLRDAAELAGCSHHTVARYVAAREAGGLSDGPVARPQLIDEFLPKVEEWMEHSKGKIRADKAHDKLLALGYLGAAEAHSRRGVTAYAPTRRSTWDPPSATPDDSPATWCSGATYVMAWAESWVALSRAADAPPPSDPIPLVTLGVDLALIC